ncbi:MAG TPA: DUF1513 domain-containing protein [Xanthobacteraceae bacterium]|nr:DUF1513 domain-containing protein [Xanthobacteraceae bacterium]
MTVSRRTALAGLGALLAAPRALVAAAHALDHGTPDWIATAEIGEGIFAPVSLAGGLDPVAAGGQAARLHWVEPAPGGPLTVAMGRRPGSLALVFDRRSGLEVARFAPEPGRCFSGHGRFAADGARFLAVEIDRASDAGVLTLRDPAAGFAVQAEWPTGGTGPHDLLRLGDTLVVANGGVEPFTPAAAGHDVTGSSIALLNSATGALTEVALPGAEYASLSLRHLARAATGPMVVAAQELVRDGIARPLLFRIGSHGALAPFEAPDGVWEGFRGYLGSTAVDVSGRFVAASSPRGGRVGIWRLDGRHLGVVPVVDGCGLAACPQPGRFLISSGLGELVLVEAGDDGLGVIARRAGGPRFDNHMSLAGA